MFCKSAALLCAILLCACENEPGPEIVLFEASSTMLPAHGGQIELTWQVTGAESVRLAHLPDELPLDGSQRLHTSAEASFTLEARQDDRLVHRTVTIRLAEPPGPVEGILLDSAYGQPLEGWTVRIGTIEVRTDSNGTFRFAMVEKPFDVEVVGDDPWRRTSYRGLGTGKLTLLDLNGHSPTHFATLRADVTTGVPNSDPVMQWTFVYAGSGLVSAGDGRSDPGFTSQLMLGWRAVIPLDLDVVAMRTAQDKDGYRYEYAASRVDGIEAGQTREVALSMAAVPTRPLAFTVMGCMPGETVAVRTTATTLRGLVFPLMLPFRAGCGSHEIGVPDAEGLVFAVEAARSGAIGTNVGFATAQSTEGAGESVVLKLPQPLELTPLSGGTVQQDGSLRWSRRDGEVCVVRVSTSRLVSLKIITEAASVDLSDMGLKVASRDQFSWSVDCYGAPDGIRSAVDGDTLLRWLNLRESVVRSTGPSEMRFTVR